MLPTQCPKCGRWLKFNMSYSYGNPVVYYTCLCGYDSSKYQTTYATTTTDFHIDKYSKESIVK